MKITIIRGNDYEQSTAELMNFERGKVLLRWIGGGGLATPMLFWLRASGPGVLSPHRAGQGCAVHSGWWIRPDHLERLAVMERASKQTEKAKKREAAAR